MIERIDPVTDKRWDAFVEAHPFGWICHLSGWKNVLEQHTQHMKGHYLAMVEGGKIRAGLPLFEVRSWLLGRRLVSVPFATLCDPLVSTEAEIADLLNSAMGLAKETRCSHIEIRTLSAGKFIRDNGFRRSDFYKHHFLTLETDFEEIQKKFHRTCVRQRVSRAQKSGLNLRMGETEEDLRKFYALYLLTRRRLELPPQPYYFFKVLWSMFFPAGRLELLLAEREKTPMAGLILLKYKCRVSAEYAGSDESFKELSPNHLLFSEVIRKAHAEGYKVFDFGRTSPTNLTLMDFKSHWGTTVVDLPQFIYPRMDLHTPDLREQSKSRRMVKKFCRRIPEPLFEKFGNLCYRHLG